VSARNRIATTGGKGCSQCSGSMAHRRAGAAYCSTACKSKAQRHRRDPATGTRAKRLNQAAAGAANLVRLGEIPGMSRESERSGEYLSKDNRPSSKFIYARATKRGRSSLRCTACGSLSPSCGCLNDDGTRPPRLRLPVWDGGMAARRRVGATGSAESTEPTGARPDPIWHAARIYGPDFVVISQPGGFIGPDGKYRPEILEDEPPFERTLRPNEKLLIGLRLARKRRAEDLDRRGYLLDVLALRWSAQHSTTRQAPAAEEARIMATPTQQTALERIDAMQAKLDTILRLTAETAERIREQFPTNAEVSAAVDTFLDTAQEPVER
jgi:hypothetical protein